MINQLTFIKLNVIKTLPSEYELLYQGICVYTMLGNTKIVT